MSIEDFQYSLSNKIEKVNSCDKLFLVLDDIDAISDNVIIENFINHHVLGIELEKLKIVLTSRRFKNRLKLNRRFILRKIKPFDLEVIKEATRNYLRKYSFAFCNDNLICKLSMIHDINIILHRRAIPEMML